MISLSGRPPRAALHRSFSRRTGALCAGTVVALAGVATASAHVVQQFGPYSIAIGWLHEPTYVGVENAVQVIVKDAAGKPVNDLADGALKVQVSTGNQASDQLTLEPSFDPDTGLGAPGEYDAPLIPTAPGVYTFHLSGAINSTRVDQSFTSSDKTFDNVTASSDAEFPAKVPTVASVATRLDRTGARVATAQTAADDARSAADRALLVGIGALVVGLVAGGAGVALAMRRRAV